MDKVFSAVGQYFNDYLSSTIPTQTEPVCHEQVIMLSDTSVLAVVITNGVIGLSGILYGVYNKVALMELQKKMHIPQTYVNKYV